MGHFSIGGPSGDQKCYSLPNDPSHGLLPCQAAGPGLDEQQQKSRKGLPARVQCFFLCRLAAPLLTLLLPLVP